MAWDDDLMRMSNLGYREINKELDRLKYSLPGLILKIRFYAITSISSTLLGISLLILFGLNAWWISLFCSIVGITTYINGTSTLIKAKKIHARTIVYLTLRDNMIKLIGFIQLMAYYRKNEDK